MISCDIDGPDLYSWTEQRAKKTYNCCECKAPITPGERYGRAFGKWEDDLSTFRQHLLCAELCMFIRDNFQDGECLPFGSMKDWFSEGYSEKTNNTHWQSRKMFAEILRRERKALRQ